MYVTGKRKRF